MQNLFGLGLDFGLIWVERSVPRFQPSPTLNFLQTLYDRGVAGFEPWIL